MPADAERSMSAPPEVVFNTATDPNRVAAWLPEPLLAADHRAPDGRTLQARWDSATGDGWSAVLRVDEVPAGGALVRLRLDAEGQPDGLPDLAEKALTCLAREVADNLTPG